ncbi:MAG: amino acid racemase [Ignavibacteriales bacterium]|nr:amino acid racemase [Ignavibacteriales bacterium]
MKTIGLIGGTGWVSTVEYYKIINEEVNRRLGGLEAAKCILVSLNYGEVDVFNKKNDSEGVFSLISNAADKLIGAGVDCILLCANTMHQFAQRLELKINVPLIHIAQATGIEIRNMGLKKVGLLGTKQTMEMDFYKSKLNEANINVLIPRIEDRDFIQTTISEELLHNIFKEESRLRFIKIIEQLKTNGAEGIVLGCTEIPLLIKQEHSGLPLFNTLEIHSMAAVDFALS